MMSAPTERSRMVRSRRHVLRSIGLAGTIGLAGCITRGIDSGVSGSISIDGSNTVLPHSAAVAEEFGWRNNQVNVSVRGSGTGAGFQQFCGGNTDVQNASRRIKDDERDFCADGDIEFVELEVALDGIALYAHPENTWCDCLTVDEIERIWEPNSTVSRWSDIRPRWPDEPITFYGRDTASGTFDYFTEAISGNVGAIRSDYNPSADTNVIVRGVSGDRYALGFGGAGYYYENTDQLKLLGVDDGDGCIKPDIETVESERYQPLTRSLFAYIRHDALAEEAVRRFAEFYFEEIDETGREAPFVDDTESLTWSQWAARSVGFFGLPDDRIEKNDAVLKEAIEAVDT